MRVFIVDSNFFISAHRSYYPLDIAVGFWSKVKQLADENKIFSIDKVKKEIYDHEDELKTWCKANLPDSFFLETSLVVPQYSLVVTWAYSKNTHFQPRALAEFLDADEADAWLVAFALENTTDRVLVTYEVSQPERKNKIKIPEPCNALGVQYCLPMEMFRTLREQF